MDVCRQMKFRLLVAAMFLESCASWQPLGSYEPQSQRDYNRDLYECGREATFADASTKQQVFDNCMRARGYKKKSSSKVGTTARCEVSRHLKQVECSPGRRTSLN